MPETTTDSTEHLNKVCKAVGGKFAVLIYPSREGWAVHAAVKLGRTRAKALNSVLNKKAVKEWLQKCKGQNKPRTRKTGKPGQELGIDRLYAFSQADSSGVLLLGIDELNKESKVLITLILGELLSNDKNKAKKILEGLSQIAAVELEIDGLAKRVNFLLQESFPADYVSMLLKSPDGEMMYDYIGQSGPKISQVYSLETTLVGYAAETRKVVRVGDVTKAPRFVEKNPGVVSKLAAPMILSNSVIGILALESQKRDAFSSQDESFLFLIASQIARLVEKARLKKETLQQVEHLSKVSDILRQLVGLITEEEISQKAAEELGKSFAYELVVIFLLDKNRDEFVAQGLGGTAASNFPRGIRQAAELGVAGDVYKTGSSRLVEDSQLEDGYFSLPGWEPRSGMFVPLKDGVEIIGVVIVESLDEKNFTEDDLNLLNVFVDLLSGVMSYARRYDEVQGTVRQLQAVRETALDISMDLDLNVLLRRVVNRARELVGARGAELGLVDENENVVKVLVSENPWQDYTGYTFPFMTGVAGRVAGLGEPVIVADYNTWGENKNEKFKAPFTTVAGVPLKLSGETIGTLIVQDDRPDRSFGPDDLRVLELLAPQVTIFIRNARLYQELEKRIEAQKLAESRLIRSAKLAAVGEMAAGVAHELNNPLTTVTGFVELLLEDFPDDSAQRQDLQLVLDEALRARGVVRRLLDFSRQTEIFRADADINEVMSEVITLVHHLARTSGVEMRIELWDDLPPLRIDRNQIQQVFLNVIHNGIQAMPDGGQIMVKTSLETREDGDWIVASIVDTGEGIDKADQLQIFEPFYTTKPTGIGTGLGLSISYGIVADHGGFIEVNSEIGKGANFTIWLPVIVDRENVNV